MSDATALTAELVDWLLGVAFGRFDIRQATGARQPIPEPEPFDPLPTAAPGMLADGDDHPMHSAGADPLAVAWDGILVDDPSHPRDLERPIQQALALIFGGDGADAIQQEACDILGVNSLRDYFRRPTAFFADHLRRYSKSRRQAPIYWPLSTPSGSYTLWLYYHRLSAQTLYSAVMNFVEPKLTQVSEEANQLRAKTERSSREEKALEQASDLEAELTGFRDQLLRIAPHWTPNLNDGVQITAAPLWPLFRLSKWQKTLKDTWAKLEKGDYDWAHLALSYWPERVLRKCHQDRSLAIAHGVEQNFWEEVEVTEKTKGKGGGKSKGGAKLEWRPKQLSDAELARLIQDLMNG